MRFAEYLRMADAMDLPNQRGDYILPRREDWRGEHPPCCAIGGAAVVSGDFVCAWDGTGETLTATSESTAMRVPSADDWEAMLVVRATHPAIGGSARPTVVVIVVNLYDTHRWSRTEIADWLDAQWPHGVGVPVPVAESHAADRNAPAPL